MLTGKMFCGAVGRGREWMGWLVGAVLRMVVPLVAVFVILAQRVQDGGDLVAIWIAVLYPVFLFVSTYTSGKAWICEQGPRIGT
jgi:hypothetical protein